MLLKIRTILTAGIVVALCASGGAITLYAGTWPPVYTVESMSMEHSSYWKEGTINTGDIVFARDISSTSSNVVTYVQGRQTGYTSYGDFGNVILFKDPQNRILIHRAMFYLTWNGDLPVVQNSENLGWISVTSGAVVIHDIGFKNRTLIVYVSGFAGKDGFITAGDYNIAHSILYNTTENAFVAADQNAFGFGPVKAQKIIGTAFGNIPWFGLVKLNVMRAAGNWPEYNQVPGNAYLFLCLSLVAISIAVLFPYGTLFERWRKRGK